MPRGGRRKGAGRPKGTGKYGEETKALRVPVSLAEKVAKFIDRQALTFPMYTNKIAAEFPEPTEDVPADGFDIADYLFRHASAVFLHKMVGDSMTGAGIYSNDILIVDKSLLPRHGDVVIVSLEEVFAVRRLGLKNDKIELRPENPKYQTIKFETEEELKIWGVVRHVVHQV